MDKRTCLLCGADISFTHALQRYCSKRCQNAKKWAERPRVPCVVCGGPTGWTLDRPPSDGVTCRECQAAVIPHGTKKGYRTHRCRCAECRRWKTEDHAAYVARRVERGLPRQAPRKNVTTYPGECERCGATFEGGYRAQRFCSLRCWGVASRKASLDELVHVGPKTSVAPPVPVTVVTAPKWWAVIVSGPCAWCGENFNGTGSTTRYCSKRCAKVAAVARRGGVFVIAPQERRAIYERDGWVCQLCFEPVDPSADPRSDWFPSLDHVVPQSHMLIPDHSPANLRTAHRWCNAIRGDGTYHANFFEEAS